MRLRAGLRRTLSSLSVRNYRLYFVGQVVSLSGNWMQIVAEIWLVLQLTDSAVAVGATTAFQFAALLLFGAYGGVLADRFPKVKLLLVTQAVMAVPAVVLWVLTVNDAVELWMVYALVFTRGLVNAFDYPARQAVVIEMVGPEQVVNAISLNSVILQSARVVGPALAGVIIALWGVGPCFLINSLTFLAMLAALLRIRAAELSPSPSTGREPGALRAGVRYARRSPELAIPLGMVAVIGTLTLNFNVMLPVLARFTFDGNAAAYSTLVSAMGAGALIGALVTGSRTDVGPRLMVRAACTVGVLTLVVASAPSLVLAAVVMVPLGSAAVTFVAGINSFLQLRAEPVMRGRIMALFSVLLLGSTPVGGPLFGWVAHVSNPRLAMTLAGTSAVLAGLVARRAFARAGLA